MPSFDSPFILLAAGATVIYILVLVWRQVASPLLSIPGPILARFTDIWYLWAVRAGNFQRHNRRLHELYGPIVRYGPNRYSLNHPEATKIIYSHKSSFQKSRWYAAFGQIHEWTLFSDDDVKRHSQNRRQYQSLYSMSSLVTYEPFVDECISIFRQRLAELAHAKHPMNMGHWMQCYAFDVIGLMTYSKRIGFLDQGEDVGGVMGALENMIFYASLAGLTPSLHPYMFRLKNWLAGKKGVGRAYVIDFTRQRVAEHQARPKSELIEFNDDDEGQPGAQKLGFLSKFYGKHTRDPESFTGYHVIAGCTHNMIAGSDTTAITLSACLYYLLRHPRTFSKLRAEIDQLRRDESRTTREVTFKESQEMPYLQAVIKETLRIHPATGLPLERVVPKGGATISNRFFPEGTIVGVNTWVEHRNPQIWGEDVDEFKPERWLIDDSDRLAFMNRHWMPFGLGARTCLGRHISMLETSKLIPSLVGDFDFKLHGRLANPEAEWNLANYWFVKPKDFMVRVTLRET
ncbi:cytochrome P450 [Aspergillus granulosus]|uniref:Cytochrome P450 n=1 Tax=Aspergillus granulosus TaxID=176169 RepID=A0ABR4H869_9EURO